MTHNNMLIWATIVVASFLLIIFLSILKQHKKEYRKYHDFRHCNKCGYSTIHLIYENVKQGDGSLKSWTKCEDCEKNKQSGYKPEYHEYISKVQHSKKKGNHGFIGNRKIEIK